jgi:hypothetical protein
MVEYSMVYTLVHTMVYTMELSVNKKSGGFLGVPWYNHGIYHGIFHRVNGP